MKRSLLYKSIFSTLLLAATLPVFLSCSQKEKTEELPPSIQAPAAMPVQNSRWKYFDTSSDGSVQLKSVDAVSEIPAVQFKPWTEAVRVTDCGFNHEQAVFLINKCGVYPIHSLQSGQPLPAKHSLFSQTSAGDLYNVDGHYFIRIYQNSVFLPQNRSENKYFLLRAESSETSYSPAADVERLHIPKNAQCKALEQRNGYWYASFKADSGTDISFFYIKCADFKYLLQEDASQHIEQISAEEFRRVCEPVHYAGMPEMLKDIADKVENDTVLYMRVFTENSAQGIPFFKPLPSNKTDNAEKNTMINAYAFYYTEDDRNYRAALLLPDGTLIINTDKLGIQTLHLPALPQHFNYTAFYISDTHITAAWEEAAFYEVGRSGIFTAELQELGR